MANSDVYGIVTDKILAELDKGTVPWRKPWNTVGPLNLVSSKHYRGVNVLLLTLAGFESPVWGTFKQWKAAGGSVRRGEKGTLITFWKTFEPKRKSDDEEPRKIPLLRYYYVFNAAQIDGTPRIPAKTAAAAAPTRLEGFEPTTAAEELIAAMPNRPGMHTGAEAFYNAAADTVTLPARESFHSPHGYYSTAFHELAHSTAHDSRVGRPIVNGFGTDAYAREELIAEITAAMLRAVAGIDATEELENTAAYIASWRKILSDDPKLIVSAAAAAQKAADYVRGIELAADSASSEPVAVAA